MHSEHKAVIPSRPSAYGVPGENDTQTHKQSKSDMFSVILLFLPLL